MDISVEIMVRSRGGVCQEERQGGLGGIFDDNWRRLRVGGFHVWEGCESGVWRVCLSAELVSAGSVGLEAIGQVASPLFSRPRSCSSTMAFQDIYCLPKNKGPLLFLSL